MALMTYEEKKAYADDFIKMKTDGELDSWDELPDINSLHDADTIEEIKELCENRLNDE